MWARYEDCVGRRSLEVWLEDEGVMRGSVVLNARRHDPTRVTSGSKVEWKEFRASNFDKPIVGESMHDVCYPRGSFIWPLRSTSYRRLGGMLVHKVAGRCRQTGLW
jgi:hypothetical protein